jgi:hypothetical protein
MTQKLPVSTPARFATPTAMGFTDNAGTLALVSQGAPLPVVITNAGDGSAAPTSPEPLVGRTEKPVIVGPFRPVPGTPIHLQLSGRWVGQVSLERSTDDGATRHGLTVGGRRWATFTGNANEPVWLDNEAGVTFWLVVELTSGELAYRVSQ